MPYRFPWIERPKSTDFRLRNVNLCDFFVAQETQFDNSCPELS